jgi:hypothetical protein
MGRGNKRFARNKMEAGQRDFVIERLEKQLLQKNEEIEHVKINLRDTILRELRDELRSDLEINNRLIRLEQKVQELTSNINGIMDELLDQKSMIQGLKGEGDKKPENPRRPGISETLFPPREKTEPETEPESDAETVPNSKPEPIRPRRTMNFNIRDIGETKPEDEAPEEEHETDYIVASAKETEPEKTDTDIHNEDCEYIIAEEKNTFRRKEESEFETVENREDEDSVITTTRRK